MLTFPYTVPALLVEQPIGDFYVVILPAELLLEVAYSDALSAHLRSNGAGYDLTGTQRLSQPKRIQPIADFINGEEAAFPNSIILAANFRAEDGTIEDDSDEEHEQTSSNTNLRWRIENSGTKNYSLIIPSAKKLAAIIDGQHRLFAFAKANPERLSMDLICSVFLDLPKPIQAQLFATINSNQKPVGKSLTYELFGYNLDEEKESYWSPDKLAIFLTRKLGTETDSALKGRIEIAPRRDRALETMVSHSLWKVSTAVVVEGIMRLITSNPKKDSTNLLSVERKERQDIAEYRKDKSPLRDVYLKSEDVILYKIILNYLNACQEVFWENATADSFITKTVGIQALFDVLRTNAQTAYEGRDIRKSYFTNLLRPASTIDFTSDKFRNASGSGRTVIKNAILDACG